MAKMLWRRSCPQTMALIGRSFGSSLAKPIRSSKGISLRCPATAKRSLRREWEKLHSAIREAAVPLKMGNLWMTGSQAACRSGINK